MEQKVNRGYFNNVNPYISVVTRKVKREEFENMKPQPSIFYKGDVMFYIGNNLFCIEGMSDDNDYYKNIEDDTIEIVEHGVIINKRATEIFKRSSFIGDEFTKKNVKKTYVMHDTINNYYKIGISAKPVFRESTLQSEKPSIILIMTKEEDIEKELHNKFKDKRIRGEWFSLNQNDLDELMGKYEFTMKNG